MAIDDLSFVAPRESVPDDQQPRDRFSVEASAAFRSGGQIVPSDKMGQPASEQMKIVARDDGTYMFDNQSRLVRSLSSDGLTNISYKYGDSENPRRITSEILNDKTETRYLGPVTENGKPLKIAGQEVNGYSIYEDGKFKTNWSGIRALDHDGVRLIGTGNDTAAESAFERYDASGRKLNAVAAEQQIVKIGNEKVSEKVSEKTAKDIVPPLHLVGDIKSPMSESSRGPEENSNLFHAAAKYSPSFAGNFELFPPKENNKYGLGKLELIEPAAADNPPKGRLVAFNRAQDGIATEQPKQAEQPHVQMERPKPEKTITNDSVAPINSREVVLEDGTYKRDANDRITEMISADGKTKHVFKRNDPKFPDRITSDVVNDQVEYRFVSNNRVNGQPYKIDGKEVSSYGLYDMKGNLTGNWSGIREVSPEGVLAIGTGNRPQAGDKGYDWFGASENKLTTAEAERRNSSGIWPDRREAEHADGTKFRADLTGRELRTLTEQKSQNGKTEEFVWTKHGDGFSCDKLPGEVRKNLELRADGTLLFEDREGVKQVKYKDGSHDTVQDGATIHYDTKGQFEKATASNGDSRSVVRSAGEVIAYADTKGGKQTTWQRSSSDQTVWTSGTTKDTRIGLETTADGAIEYKNEKGSRIRENAQFSKIEFNSDNKPTKVTLDHSERIFDWSGDQLKSITDNVTAKSGVTTTTWSSDDGKKFTRDVNGRIRSCELQQPPDADGNYSYKNADGNLRVSKATSLERQASGELGGSENVIEAREDLMDAIKAKGINSARIEGYLKKLEVNIQKYDVKPEQLVKSFDNLREVLVSPDKSPYFSDEERKKIVETAIHNISNVMEIDQGSHPTCNVTTVEIYAAARHPDEYARLVKEVTLSGKWTTSEGRVANIPSEAVRPGEDESNYDLDKPNTKLRNMASQIVEMTLINTIYEHGYNNKIEFEKKNDGSNSLVTVNGKAVEKLVEDRSGMRYILTKGEQKSEKQRLPNGQETTITWKTGEDTFRDANGKLRPIGSGGPEFITDKVVKAGKLMFGYNMPYIDGPATPDGGVPEYDFLTEARALKMKAENKFPHGIATMGGEHVQTIHDVTRGKDGKVYVLLDNQHGEEADGWTTIDEIVKTQRTSPPKQEQYEIKPKIRRWERPDK